MKKTTTLLLLLLLSVSLFAQKQVLKAVNSVKSYTKPQSVSALNRATTLEPIENTFTARNTAVQFVADAAVLNQMETAKPKFVEFVIPVSANETMVLELIPNDIFGDKFQVGTTLTNAAALTRTVNLQWEITPSVLTGNVATLALGWTTANHGTAFNPNAPIEIAHYNGSKWDKFYLATLTGPNPYVATVTGVNTFSPFVVANQNALSVELLDFKGTPQYNGNLLTWETANEVNNKGFYVETRFIASNPAQSTTTDEWKTLGFVKSKGKAATYDFTHTLDAINRVSTSYYRLRQIDDDGKETLSKTISIARRDAINRVSIKVYPNPAHNRLTIDYPIDVQKELEQYTVVNTLGQTLLQGKLASNNLDISSLPTGAFIIKIGEAQCKFFKQ